MPVYVEGLGWMLTLEEEKIYRERWALSESGGVDLDCKHKAEIGDRVKGRMVKPNSIIGSYVVGAVTTMLDNGRVFIKDDIYGKEWEVFPEDLEVLRKKSNPQEDK